MKAIARKWMFFSLLLVAMNYCWAQDSDPPIRKGQKGGAAGPNHANAVLPSLTGNVVLGSPSKTSVVANIIAEQDMAVCIEYSQKSGEFTSKTSPQTSLKGEPVEIIISNLKPNSKYYYRVCYKLKGSADYQTGSQHSFYTQRAAGATFSFGVQGDSHPERPGKMFDSELYHITMQNVANASPDFYFLMGDDFGIERLIERNQVSPPSVDNVYLYQRQYVERVGSNSPLFLVNGNHEQAAKYLLDGTANNPAVCAALSRKKFYPLPAPDKFYSGNTEAIEHAGLLKDYYAFEWGNALFVVIDFYWHSENAVDNKAGTRGKDRNIWNNTLGDTQYQWFKKTLEKSPARYKFVFTHHVLGTGRGGVECSGLGEWGGYNQQGTWEFDKMRPGWEMPLHQLMVKHKVTIIFQGHDHIFAKQERDGIIYQSVPNPADNTYTAFNTDAYKTGVKHPNSGFLNITVSDKQVTVDYIRSFLPKDTSSENKNGVIAYSYTIQ